jgi:hypothetical protein
VHVPADHPDAVDPTEHDRSGRRQGRLRQGPTALQQLRDRRPTGDRQGGTKALGTRNTDSFGYYAFRFDPLAKTSVSATSSFDSVARGRPQHLDVRAHEHHRAVGDPGWVQGQRDRHDVPEEDGVTVSTQRRLTSGGKFVGWSTAARVRTTSTGTFKGTVLLPCGSKQGMSTYVVAMTGNAAGRTPTVTLTAVR